MPLPTHAELVTYLAAHTGRPPRLRELARMFDIREDEYRAFRRLVQELREEDVLGPAKGGRVVVMTPSAEMEGTLRVARAGFGVVTTESAGEYYVHRLNLRAATDGDTVLIRPHGKGRPTGRPEAVVIDIVHRRVETFLASFYHSRRGPLVNPQDPRLGARLSVHDVAPEVGTLDAIEDGLIVTCELLPPRDRYSGPSARVLEVLGRPDDPRLDVLATVREFGLPWRFPPEVLADAERYPETISAQEWTSRTDWRNVLTFTIDPADAKDHDDAVSLVRLNAEDGRPERWQLGVHIADVSEAVRDDQPLDREARDRGTSVYLPGTVIPMLPERLSGELCSLRVDEDRRCLSCIMELSDDAHMLDYRIESTVIRSHYKLTYERAQQLLDHPEGDPLSKTLNAMNILAHHLRAARIKNGAVELDIPEYRVRLDRRGEVVGLDREERWDSNRLIEEFMLLANKTVARYCQSHHVPTLFRVHDRPSQERVDALIALLVSVGLDAHVSPDVSGKSVQRLLAKVAGTPEESVVHAMLLRTFARAIYQPKNIGHWGLAFASYVHFTSPIRRYPDLLTHRALKAHLRGELSMTAKRSLLAALDLIGQTCSETEHRADQAERHALKVKQVKYLARHIDEVYEGQITGVVSFGFFVVLTAVGAEGLVRVAQMGEDFYIHDAQAQRMVGRKYREVFRLGDRVRVRVRHVDIPRLEVTLELIERIGVPIEHHGPLPEYEPTSASRRNAESSTTAPRRGRGPARKKRPTTVGTEPRAKSHRKGRSLRRKAR